MPAFQGGSQNELAQVRMLYMPLEHILRSLAGVVSISSCRLGPGRNSRQSLVGFLNDLAIGDKHADVQNHWEDH